MQVSEAMTRDVRLANPDQTIADAARVMAECEIGSLPVGENDRLVGMITDRDIAIRAVAQGRSPDTKIRDVMSGDVKYCFEDEDVTSVAQNLGDIQLHRLPVVNRDKRLVGIVALADIAKTEGPRPAGQAVCGISQPGGQHTTASGSSSQQHQSQGAQRQWGASGEQSGSSQQQQESGATRPQAGQTGQGGQTGSQRQQVQSESSRQPTESGGPGQQQQAAGASSMQHGQQQGGSAGQQVQQGGPSQPQQGISGQQSQSQPGGTKQPGQSSDRNR